MTNIEMANAAWEELKAEIIRLGQNVPDELFDEAAVALNALFEAENAL